MTLAIVPGSFDPVTFGHVDIIERAAKLFDHVNAVVMINANKTYAFSEQQKLQMLRQAVAHIENVTVEFHGGMLWEYARDVGACAIVKGIRNPKDTQYEIEMAAYNTERYSAVETLLLPTSKGFERISSENAKARVRAGEHAGFIVPPHVEQALRELYKGE